MVEVVGRVLAWVVVVVLQISSSSRYTHSIPMLGWSLNAHVGPLPGLYGACGVAAGGAGGSGIFEVGGHDYVQLTEWRPNNVYHQYLGQY